MPLTRPKKVLTGNLEGSIAAGNISLPAGSIIQNVIGTIRTSANITSSSFVTTGLYVDITPTSAANDIHLDFDFKIYMHNTSYVSATTWAVYRKIGSGSMTAWKYISGWDNYINRNGYAYDFYPHQRYFVYDDSHNTTSTIRYEMYAKNYANVGGVQTYFEENTITPIPNSTHSPGFSSNSDQIDMGMIIAQEIQR